MKIEFEKQFGKGTDPWYAKAERWVKKKFKNPYLQHLALGFVAWLKEIWIEGKIKMEMSSVDKQVEDLHELWDEEESNKRMDVIGQNGNLGIHYSKSEVDGLNDMSIGRVGELQWEIEEMKKAIVDAADDYDKYVGG